MEYNAKFYTQEGIEAGNQLGIFAFTPLILVSATQGQCYRDAMVRNAKIR